MPPTINVDELIHKAEKALAEKWQEFDEIAFSNQARVLEAFHTHRLSEEVFVEKTGYGRNDAARDTIDKIFASIFGAQTAAVRMQMVSGTHALAIALFGNLKPGDRLACLTGNPYDTLEEVIGISGNESGSLKSLGVSYVQRDIVPIYENNKALNDTIQEAVSPPTAMAYIQKSCGYSYGRPSLSSKQIGQLAQLVHKVNPHCVVLVDNCYGEFVEADEPTHVGADIIAGSLIKNPGGGIALTGGYIAGKAHLVDQALNRLTAPGIGGHIGLTYNQNRFILQGLFLAPSVVAQALRGATLCAYVFTELGVEVSPLPFDQRQDIIQAVCFGKPTRLINFCRAIQRFSPVNSHVIPEPAPMTGYPNEVVMAGGTFIEGSTIELSADGPLRPPYAAYLQGGLSYHHVKYALKGALELSLSGTHPFLNG